MTIVFGFMAHSPLYQFLDELCEIIQFPIANQAIANSDRDLGVGNVDNLLVPLNGKNNQVLLCKAGRSCKPLKKLYTPSFYSGKLNPSVYPYIGCYTWFKYIFQYEEIGAGTRRKKIVIYKKSLLN